MADVYIVQDQIIARKKPNINGDQVKTYKKGQEVKIYDTSSGWGNTAKSGNTWVKMTMLKKTSTESEAKTSSAPDGAGAKKENTDKVKNDTIYGTSDSSYNALMLRYIRAFGSPPRFTKEVDPYYNNEKGIYTGRAMSKTWFSDPSIFSICPGTVDYLPGFSKKAKDQFWKKMKGSMNSEVKRLSKKDRNTDLNGKLYAFNSAYKDYMNVVNLLARVSADYLGIGNVTDLYYGTKISLNKFDYGFYTNPSKASAKKSIFADTKTNLINTAVSDGAYIHFFVNHSGVNVGDQFAVEAGNSMLDDALNNSNVNTIAQNLNYMFGGAIGADAEKDIETVLQDARDRSQFLGSFATISKNYLKGGRLVFPKMITGVDYSKTIEVQLSFASIYGDKRSIFKYTILPALHLLALASPKQVSDNMYTYPYLVRCYQKGKVNCDLAYMSNLSFKRGGSDDTSWTVDELATEITATFSITPLYSEMMVTSARNPFLFMQNTALMEYLGTLCGLDLKANNLGVKVKLAKQLLNNYVTDTPTNLARGIIDSKFVKEIRKYTQITN